LKDFLMEIKKRYKKHVGHETLLMIINVLMGVT